MNEHEALFRLISQSFHKQKTKNMKGHEKLMMTDAEVVKHIADIQK